MRNTIFAGIALSVLAALPAMAAPAPALLLEEPPVSTLSSLAAQSQGRVEVWMDGRRDLYRPGERMSVNVRAEQDGYLAVFHIDTNGDVDVLFPRSYSDDGWVDGGRTMRLGSRYESGYLRSRGGYGMGYVMAVTLDEPLELHRVREMYGVRTAGWDGNRGVFGDPFYAMDELVRAIVPESAYGYESVDYTTYHVGRRYRYPRYACYDSYGDWYHYRGVYWDDCDRVRVLLVRYPHYYDAYRWRGSRRPYYGDYYRRVPVRNRPLHGYKERTDSYAPPARTASRRPSPADRNGGGTASADRPRSRGSDDRPSGGSATDRPGGEGSVSRRPERVPGRARTSPGRTGDAAMPGGTGDAVSTGRSVPGTRTTRPPRGARQDQQDEAQPPQQDRPVQPSRERPTFQRRPPSESPPARSAEPRRESPPSRSAEPRRESPPSRSAEPRRESPPRSEPRRESPPARSAEPRRESSGSSSGSARSSDGGSRGSSSGGSRSVPGRRP